MAEIRYCPLCRRELEGNRCPVHEVPTLPLDLLDGVKPSTLLGLVLGERYRIDEPLGMGGMGEVYRATDLEKGERVAIKTLRKERLNNPRQLQRFAREADALRTLRSPHILRVLDSDLRVEADPPWMALELLEGHTLADLLHSQRHTDPRFAAAILSQVVTALLEAADAGIVHRDLKPSNLFLLDRGGAVPFVKVMDFGLSKRSLDPDGVWDSVTLTGAKVGTPFYMAPEQVDSGDVDFRTDLYAVGCLLHKMLTGLTPFEAEMDTNAEFVVRARHKLLPPPTLPSPLPCGEVAPAPLVALHQALLAKDPADRPQHTAAVIEVLRAVADGRSVDVGAVLRAARQGRVKGDVRDEGTRIGAPAMAPPSPAGVAPALIWGAAWLAAVGCVAAMIWASTS